MKLPIWALTISTVLLIATIGWKMHQAESLEQNDVVVHGSQLADLVDSPLVYAKVWIKRVSKVIVQLR